MVPVVAQGRFSLAPLRESDPPIPIFRQDRKCEVGLHFGCPTVENLGAPVAGWIYPGAFMGGAIGCLWDG